jgi:uncharacterized glyoxalase superfamily protein PhnB
MANLSAIEIKAFVPAKDFGLSKKFYQDLGFVLASDADGIAYFHCGEASFLLQDFYVEECAKNFMMHMLVEDVDAWSKRVAESGIATKYGVKITDVVQQPWRMRDFVVVDPSGVLWRIAQNTN